MKTFINSKKEIEEILSNNNLGFLSMMDASVPYTIPITYGYNEGSIIFHCNLKGKKIDILKRNDYVSFVVAKQYGEFVSHPQGAKCHAHSDSAICYGKAIVIEDIAERTVLLNIFNKCIANDAREIRPDEVRGCYAVKIEIDDTTARIERDSKCTYYRYRFIEQDGHFYSEVR
jgi:uncharacterized protein